MPKSLRRLHGQFLATVIIIACLSIFQIPDISQQYHGDISENVDEVDMLTEANFKVNNMASVEKVSFFKNPESQIDTVEASSIQHSFVNVIGSRRDKKGFLTIGVPSIKRLNGDGYLFQTLESLISEISEQEKEEVVVMVFLADFDRHHNHRVIHMITEKYEVYLNSGFLQVVQVSEELYPQLDHLKRNFNDDPLRVKWRSKQNIDFAFMFIYGHNISSYYIQIEDDVVCAPKFVAAIKDYISMVSTKKWIMLEFSHLGFIGKLLRSQDVLLLGQYLLLFYDEQPCDWLINHFVTSMGQKSKYIRKPTLFQHEGLVSSLQDKPVLGFNKLKDRYFGGKDIPTFKEPNPPAALESNMAPEANNSIENAYGYDDKYFWTRPSPGGYILVRFKELIRIDAIAIHTGNENHKSDILRNGVVEIGKVDPGGSSDLNGSAVKECGRFEVVGKIDSSFFYWQEVNITKSDYYTACIRIRVKRPQRAWLIVQHIQVRVKKEKKTELSITTETVPHS